MDNTCILYQYEDVQIIENAVFPPCKGPLYNMLSVHFGEDKTQSILFLQMEIKVLFADLLGELLLAYEKVGTAFSFSIFIQHFR